MTALASRAQPAPGGEGSPPKDLSEATDVAPDQVSRLPCPSIIREVDLVDQPADPGRIGRLLHQNAAWVERCMVTYGRRVAKPAPVDLDAREDIDEIWESSEPEEIGREEAGAEGLPVKTPKPGRELKPLIPGLDTP